MPRQKIERIGDENRRHMLLAALFARSNYGQLPPDPRDQKHMQGCEFSTLDSAVNHVCGPLCESDDHQDMFLGEAKSWRSRFKRMPITELQETWPDMWALYLNCSPQPEVADATV